MLSVIGYANLIDEIAKELTKEQIGNQRLWSNTVPGCLLWMDDVALAHQDKKEVKKMLNTTDEMAKRFHIKFGKEKSQILTIKNSDVTPCLKIGDQTMDQTDTYKYLGMTMNNKGNLDDHIKKLRGKTEVALQTILTLASNDEFHNIEMATIWRLYHSCIIPIMTYGAETWTPTQKELNQIQKIRDNTLKRILRTPITTPSEILTAETGIWDIETLMWKKQITYYHKIISITDKNSTLYKCATDPKNPWNKQIHQTLSTLKTTDEQLLAMSPYQLKRQITDRLRDHQMGKIYKAAENKSKVRDYICNKTRKSVAKKPCYMDTMNRTSCSNIFKTRSRMLNIKGNYKNKHPDLKCRWCKQKPETQTHILKECPNFKEITQFTKHSTYYSDKDSEHKEAALKLSQIIPQIDLLKC